MKPAVIQLILVIVQAILQAYTKAQSAVKTFIGFR